MKNKSDILKIAIFLVLGIFLAWYSLREVSINEMLGYFSDANIWLILAALSVGILSHLSRALRWKLMLEPLGYKPKTSNAFFAVMIGYFANLVPPRVGEFLRCGILQRYDKIPTQSSFGTVVAERLVDTLILGILFVINLQVQYQQLNDYAQREIIGPLSEKLSGTKLLIFMLIAGVAGLVFILYLFFGAKSKKESKTRGFIKKFSLGFIDGLRSIAKVKNPYLYILHTCIIWGGYYITIWLFFLAFPALSEVGHGAILTVFIFGTVGMIVTPGGTGAYPALVAQTLTLYGFVTKVGTSFGWLVWSSQTLLFIIFGIISLLLLPILNKKSV